MFTARMKAANVSFHCSRLAQNNILSGILGSDKPIIKVLLTVGDAPRKNHVSWRLIGVIKEVEACCNCDQSSGLVEGECLFSTDR